MQRVWAAIMAFCLLAATGVANAQNGENESKVIEGVQSLEVSTVRLTFRESDGDPGICSGVVVAPFVVLTAAHCSCGLPGSYGIQFPRKRPDEEELQVLKDNEQPLLDKPTPILRPTPMDAGFCTDQGRFGHDVAFVKFDYKSSPRPIAVLDLRHVYEARTTKLIVVGFGLRENRRFPELPYEAPVRIMSLFCSTGAVAKSTCAPFREFALGYGQFENGQPAADTCGGDSGGPVLWQANNGKRYLVGLTSRALEGVQQLDTLNCGGGGIYTSLSHLDIRRWLESNGIDISYYRSP